MPAHNQKTPTNTKGSSGGQPVRLRTDEMPIGQGDDNRENGVCIDKYNRDNEPPEERR